MTQCSNFFHPPFSGGRQNRLLWRQEPPHSYDINICPANDFFKFRNKKSCKEPNQENTVYGATVRRLIRSKWLWNSGCVYQCILMVENHFLRLMRWFFFTIRRRIGSIIRHSKVLWPFGCSPVSQCRSYLVNSIKR